MPPSGYVNYDIASLFLKWNLETEFLIVCQQKNVWLFVYAISIAVLPWNKKDVYQFDEKILIHKATIDSAAKPEEGGNYTLEYLLFEFSDYR